MVGYIGQDGGWEFCGLCYDGSVDVFDVVDEIRLGVYGDFLMEELKMQLGDYV